MAKRAMVLPTNLPAGMDEWLPEQVARAYDVTKQCTKSTSVFRALSDRRAESLGLSGLCGCTVLAIISREAVFMAHYFEDRSFNPNSEDELDGIPLTPQRAFDETVIKGLYEGLSHYQRSLSQFAGHFQRAATAFLITPSYGTGNRPVRDPYRPLLSQLKHAVQDIVPDLTRTGAWNEVQYNALDISSADLDDTARGSIVFKYDPYQQDVYPEHLAGLWFEYQQLYVDKW
ncbi:MAG: hypothetical protein M1817_005810 [Caeruleum heppii]|nr:MAG: hypothetical protein M1817_005810 [Caeruleum heppii]